MTHPSRPPPNRPRAWPGAAPPSNAAWDAGPCRAPPSRLRFGCYRTHEARVAQPVSIAVRLPGHGDRQPLTGQPPRAPQELPHGRRSARG
eukprot:564783-Pleurochrysis_carterae.AAC.3